MKINWAYIAGFFDGEGCIYHQYDENRRMFRSKVQLTQREPLVLEEISKFLTAKGIAHVVKDYGIQFRLEIYRQYDIGKFLKGVEPYVIVKLKKTNEMLAWLGTRQHYQQQVRVLKGGN